MIAVQNDIATSKSNALPLDFELRGKVVDFGVRNDHDHVFDFASFDEWLEQKINVPLLFMHKEQLQIGETMGFYKKEDGLYCSAKIFDTPVGRDTKKLLVAGCINSFSTGYKWSAKRNPEPMFAGSYNINFVHSIDEVSLVFLPAGVHTLIEGSGLTERESTAEAIYNRIDPFWMIPFETEEIREWALFYWRLANRIKNNELFEQKPHLWY